MVSNSSLGSVESDDSSASEGETKQVQSTHSAFVRTRKYGFYQSVSPSTQMLAKQAQKALHRNRMIVKASKTRQMTGENYSRKSECVDDTISSVGSEELSVFSEEHEDDQAFLKIVSGGGQVCSSPSETRKGGWRITPTGTEGTGGFGIEAQLFDSDSPILDSDGNELTDEVSSAAKGHLSHLDGLLPVLVSCSSSGEESEQDDDEFDFLAEHQQKYPESILRLMKPPPKQLMDLLIVVRNEPPGPRRSNACGALKTLASQKSNRVRMAWTKGVIVSLAHVLNDVSATKAEMDRSLFALLYLSIPPRNWAILHQSPGVIEGLTKAMGATCVQARNTSCLCVEQLAKHKGNRRVMAENDELLVKLKAVIEDNTPKVNIVSATKEFIDEMRDILSNDDGDMDPKKAAEVNKASTLTALTTVLSISNMKDLSYALARKQFLMSALVSATCKLHASANVACCMIFANLSRHPENALQLVYQVKGLVRALVTAASSDDVDCRQFACYALQNLSCDGGCRQELGNTPNLLLTVSRCCRSEGREREQLAALTTLTNLSKEASNVVNFTSAEDCTKTLIEFAKPNNSNPSMRFLACDALATLAFWIRKSLVAGAEKDSRSQSMLKETFPSLEESVWEQWT